jgi:hypothetical protein
MVYGVVAMVVVVLLFMAATSPRAFVVVLTLALLSLGVWYFFSPEPKYENEPPTRVTAP